MQLNEKIEKTIKKVKFYLIAHKIISVIVLIMLLYAGYWGYKKFTDMEGVARYVTAKVERGIVVASVSGSGQVSSLSKVDVKTKVSGDVVYLGTQDGQRIGAGGLIAKLDDKDAQKAVRDAEMNLESAKITLEKLKIEKSKENMNADLAQAYDDGFNNVSNVFLDLPGIMTGIDDMFFNSDLSAGQSNIEWYIGKVASEDSGKAILYKENFLNSYNLAVKAYNVNFENYKSTSRTSDNAIIEKIILETYDTSKMIADAVKNANNYIDFVNDSIQRHDLDAPAIIATHKSSLSAYTSKTNAHLLSLLTAKTSIKDYKDSFLNADLDIKSAELTIRQKENALQDTKEKLADYFIRAPFDGTVAKINIKKSDTISSGVIVATLITKTQLAEISLNEVDVAKIKIGQKATLTFDAIPDLTISGIVADIDTVGTISQGVVTYIVKISFSAQDERVKTAMSVSAEITTDTREGVLVVPNSAVKSQSGKSYVEAFNMSLAPSTDELAGSVSEIPPDKIPVEIGLSNDRESEIVSGIKEGDEIIIKTILGAAAKAVAPSIFGSPATGGNRGTRIQTR
ncbi:hypothetical protein A3A05_02365 [Candidatus Nomurabacteria bacterium RIFCSPLOWO2_01_FULL_41_12]|uniref:Membrane fusion protein biotin-lipoyl like domain-containing protein n=1 Tax=Candidatus Nomurabacteria bacterium RIFCSPLOWO2_01_FULL_41_12 TaxID=1801774 RepID=A0A1F6WUH8_9BACT|nr:MAG: hypothetical protein A2732_01050 [Candidatus Nomurabacteria bacterium RIFCSPHIGHO2_01_FULL_40_10]OGI85553.1 MAG: hypothetical protein A3A05_02365 [Candidatus Nomurabacteria bacterium RIFCSPLOWO2_01_FULL_41_12]